MAKGGRVIVEKSRRGISRWKGDEEDEEDEEYIAEEEEELESESYDESLAFSSDSEGDGGEFGGNSEDSSGSDGSFEEGSDFEFDDSEFEEEEEIRPKNSKKGRKKSGTKQTKTTRKVSDSDEDDEDFDIKPVSNQNRRKQSRKNESEESDYEEEEDEDFDDLDEDEDFTPDVEDEDEESFSLSKRKNGYRKEKVSRSPVKRARKSKKSKVSRRKKPTVTKSKKENKSRSKRRRGRKRSSPKEPATKRRRRLTQAKEDDFIVDDDDDFIVEDWVEAKKKNNKRKPVSDSDTSEFEFVTSDEDEFVIQEQIGPKKRKKYNVCCSESDSSDSDYVIYEEEEVVKEARKRKREDVKGKEKEGEKEEDSGKKVCGICLSEEQRRTTRGVLDCCAHFFCFACIVEWSKVESRCPVCKRRFETITKASSSDSDDLGFGAPRKVIKVPKRDQVYQPSEEDIRGMLDPYENVVCMECQQGGDDNLMLLCDICDSSAHTYCVGLGNSVPEGNWYCDCCRSAGVGPSNLQPQPQPQTSVGPTDPAPTEFDPCVNMQPTHSSSSALEIDLNAPPRDILEEAGTQVLGGPSQVLSPSAGGAATLSGRRAIRNRIRILLSNSRPMQVVRRNGEEGHGVSNGVGFGLRVGRSIGQQGSILAPHRERGGPHDADRAKEQVRSMAKNHLKQLCSNAPLDRDAVKEVTRRATYTVLAVCGFGVEHRNLVSNSISAPIGCSHESHDSEQTSLLAGSCSACFDSFVRDVVVSILNRG